MVDLFFDKKYFQVYKLKEVTLVPSFFDDLIKRRKGKHFTVKCKYLRLKIKLADKNKYGVLQLNAELK